MIFDAVKTNLEKLGYPVCCFADGAAAAEWLAREIRGKTVAFGGSVTLDRLGLYPRLREHNRVLWHWYPPEGRTADDVRREARSAQVYLSSVNGLAETGELVNIDGAGNRVSAIFYGHETVWLVIGKNKLAPDLSAAVWRARNVASPKNAQRLGAKTPCAEKGDRCYDCQSPGRICRELAVLWRKPVGADIRIVLIDEELGY